DERASAKDRRRTGFHGERAIGEIARLTELAERIPEPVQRTDETERDLGAIFPPDCPTGARAEVVLLVHQLGDEPGDVRAADEIRRRGFDHAEIVVDV